MGKFFLGLRGSATGAFAHIAGPGGHHAIIRGGHWGKIAVAPTSATGICPCKVHVFKVVNGDGASHTTAGA